MKFLFYLVIGMAIVLILRRIFSPAFPPADKEEKVKYRFRPKLSNKSTWVQVYDTDSPEEIQSLQARLEEEEIECFVYEQGRKDIHGNSLKGFGIAVPKTSVGHAQRIIARMPA